MAEKSKPTIRIRWVRSGIGFSYRAKEMVRSLGLRRLRQVVERPDTPQIRGLVAKIPHLVEVVTEPPGPAELSVPEYTVGPVEEAAVRTAARAAKKAAEGEEEKVARKKVAATVGQPTDEEMPAKAAKAPVAAAEPVRAGKKSKHVARGKVKADTAIEAKKKGKAAAAKSSKPGKKGKK